MTRKDDEKLLKAAGWKRTPIGYAEMWQGPHGPAWMSEADAVAHVLRDAEGLIDLDKEDK